MNKNKEKIKKKTIVMTIIGITFMLLLIISSTYAYFMVNATDKTSSTVITSHTEKVATASLTQNTSSLKLNLSASDMSLSNVGNYYADDENDYAPNKSLGYHELSTLTLTNSNEDNNIYKCSMTVNVTFDIDSNSIGSAILEDDLKIHFMIGNQNYEYDLSEYKTEGTLSRDIETELIGNSDKILYGYVELRNKETEQNYLAGKDLNIEINTTLNKCELTGKEGVFALLDDSTTGKTYRSVEYKNKIKNVEFVNYINIDKAAANEEGEAIKWDLTKTSGERKSPAGSIIGWLEDNGDEMYNLYIGTKKSNQVIFAENLYRAFAGMTGLENFNFSNLNTSMTTSMTETFEGVGIETLNLNPIDTSKVTSMSAMFSQVTKIKSIDLNNFNTANVTNMYQMFLYSSSIIEIKIDNFNTSNVTNMGYMFGNTGVTSLDLSNFDTSKVDNMYTMFGACFWLKELNISSFTTDNLKNTSDMFASTILENLNIRNMNLPKITNYNGMFKYSSNHHPTIIVKDEVNKKWVEDRLNETGVSANVIIAN